MAKLAAHHLERKACVYVRQSSLAQVQHHRESTQRQYHLRERAIALGWQPEKVEVIDEDQGRSGATADGRGGFQRLVSDVALGKVGGVLGLEVSRLARSCADWHRLLEVAALARTLIIDEDGVYDPNQYNDRLLLGLKGTMSEAELHFLKQRMVGGRRNKARRGAFRIRLPIGYVWEPGEGIRMDPDERVRDAVNLFFLTFDRRGTAAAVARHFADMRQPFPRRDGWGSDSAEVTWGELGFSRAATLLRNPIYAGTYAYSRNCPPAEDPEDPSSDGRILIPESHPGYITEEQYRANGARLLANRSLYHGMRNKGHAREGRSLLTGIVLCGVCGRHMNVLYRRKGGPSYSCRSPRTNKICQEFCSRHVEPVVEQEILQALNAKELRLAVRALEKVDERIREMEQQWQKRIEAARYEAEKAARRYHRVEPENRLVARTLETEWNLRLQDVARVEKEYGEARQKAPLALTPEQRAKILTLATDLPRLWKAPTTQASQKKQVLRLLVEDVTLRNLEEPWCTQVAIRWKTGVVSRHQAERVVPHPQTTAATVVARIQALYLERYDEGVADALNAEGFRTGYGNTFTAERVAHIRLRRGLRKRQGWRPDGDRAGP